MAERSPSDDSPGPDPYAFAEAVVAALGPPEFGYRERLLEPTRALFAGASPAELGEFFARLAQAGAEWGYEPPHTLARRLSHIVLDEVLEPGSGLINGDVLDRVAARPLLLMGNHLSFVDANVADYLLTRGGHDDVAGRLSVIVGPKVFSDPLRKIATLCFGTIKTPQSTSRASGEALMAPREVARIARRTLAVAQHRLASRDVLLVFPEGTRSRTGKLQRTLSGVARYLARGEPLLVPFGLVGTDRLIPIDQHEELHRAEVVMRLGEPIEARALLERSGGRRALVMDAVGFAVAACLPEAERGVYGPDSPHDSARAIAAELGVSA